jgi:hypothetical protein
VVQRGEQTRFPFKADQPFVIGGDDRRQHFDRYIATQFRVASAIHLTHAAGA